MNRSDTDSLYKLLRDHGDLLGTSGTTVLALKSFIESIKQVKCTADTIRPLIDELSDTIKHSEPRIPPLIHMVKQFETEMQSYFDADVEQIKAQAERILSQKIEAFETSVQTVTEKGMDHVRDGDVILVHSSSAVVIRILVGARKILKRNFSVIILKQDFTKTKQLIKAVKQAGIAHQVIPEYSLSHYMDSATKLFLGAVSVTEDNCVVAAVGTENIVSLCHTNNIAVYLFISTYKLSRHPSSYQRIHKKEQDVCHEDCAYRLTTHSHSLIGLSLIDHFITEYGEMGKSSYSQYLL